MDEIGVNDKILIKNLKKKKRWDRRFFKYKHISKG